jgi:hypothetical protein
VGAVCGNLGGRRSIVTGLERGEPGRVSEVRGGIMPTVKRLVAARAGREKIESLVECAGSMIETALPPIRKMMQRAVNLVLQRGFRG